MNAPRSFLTLFLLLSILVSSVHAAPDNSWTIFTVFFVIFIILMALAIIAGIIKVLFGDRFGWETHAWSTCEYLLDSVYWIVSSEMSSMKFFIGNDRNLRFVTIDLNRLNRFKQNQVSKNCFKWWTTNYFYDIPFFSTTTTYQRPNSNCCLFHALVLRIPKGLRPWILD